MIEIIVGGVRCLARSYATARPRPAPHGPPGGRSPPTPDLNSGLGVVDVVGRKLLHVVGYGALFLLCRRALGDRRSATATAAGLAVTFAILDETIQGFTRGRSESPLDVLIDASGVALAYLLVRRRSRARATAR